jgi:hypothetical protein
MLIITIFFCIHACLADLYGGQFFVFVEIYLSALSSLSTGYPLIFVTFVAFGVIALLYLVFNELLVEARDAQEGNVRWWVTAVVFVGFYVVLMMDLAIE